MQNLSDKRKSVNLHKVDTLELNCPCHRSTACASNSTLCKTQHGQPKHIQHFNAWLWLRQKRKLKPVSVMILTLTTTTTTK